METTPYLKKIPLFSILAGDQLNIIQASCREASFPKDSVILYQGEESCDLYIIFSGKVKVSLLNEEGREITLEILKEGDFFGELSLFDRKPRSAMVTAVEDVRMLVLTREAFLKIIEENPGVSVTLFAVMSRRLRIADERIETLTFMDVCGRVTKMLIDLVNERGAVLEDGCMRIACPPTHQVIANQIGASREAVTKALKSLASRGFISLRGREITINMKRLDIVK